MKASRENGQTAYNDKCHEQSFRCQESACCAAADQGNDQSFYREEFASPLLSSSYEPLLDVNTIRVFVKITQVTMMMGSPHPFQIWPLYRYMDIL